VGEPLSLGHRPGGRLGREAVTEASDRIRDAIAAMLPPEQRPLDERPPSDSARSSRGDR
jgi:hypothetical protein